MGSSKNYNETLFCASSPFTITTIIIIVIINVIIVIMNHHHHPTENLVSMCQVQRVLCSLWPTTPYPGSILQHPPSLLSSSTQHILETLITNCFFCAHSFFSQFSTLENKSRLFSPKLDHRNWLIIFPVWGQMGNKVIWKKSPWFSGQIWNGE